MWYNKVNQGDNMRKLKLYLDTSIFNFAITDKPSLEIHKKATLDLLNEIQQNRYEGYISEQVVVEINRASQEKAKILNDLLKKFDFEELVLEKEVEQLADKYVEEGLIPVRYRDDALHIAVASVNDIDVVVSWNFEHIVKLKTKHGVIGINGLLGYKAIEIVSPEEVI